MLRVLHSDIPAEGIITLSPEESHHLVRVRRATAQSEIEVLDGHGFRAKAVLLDAHPKRAVLELRHRLFYPQALPPVALWQALPKGKTMDVIVQQATELGVSAIQPLITDHTEVQLDERRTEHKIVKWAGVAEEAIKQCGNPWRPQILPPRTLHAALKEHEPNSPGLVASLHPPVSTIRQSIGPISPDRFIPVAIGPEGDFSSREYDLFEEAGWISVTLGPLVLRAETASCAMLALVLNELREHLKP